MADYFEILESELHQEDGDVFAPQHHFAMEWLHNYADEELHLI